MIRCSIPTFAIPFGVLLSLVSTVHGQDSYVFPRSFQQELERLQNAQDVPAIPSNGVANPHLEHNNLAARLSTKPRIKAPNSNVVRRDLDPSEKIVSQKHVLWKSDQFTHRRLMFEEPCLERNGLQCGEKKQVMKSAAKFFSRGFIYPVAAILGIGRDCEPTDDCPETTLK